ncbi:(Na+)-NQR maturation NqrM [Marinobacterium weihaiense]|uniref:(Na+)-NQR maturation NqrM n=1 Tax=Marinobacterium weihaiense TaxID=2851016 RepID=A0ABS6M8E2_9GAMM|nr:(Na+)-NQR maturation NqrM [Marinobacterium weihaiense]MBV0932156.1 (Na+)-NQR maturation NqrM [Marinobacterium weihaiense]
MDIMILTFAALLLIITAMSVGVLLGRKPIAGSCGGMASLGMDTVCDICGGDPNKCDEEQENVNVAVSPAELAYEIKSKG